MRRNAILLVLIAAGAGLGVRYFTERKEPAPAVSLPPSRPNVVLISLDTLRADHLGCYGYTRPTSPNLDRFASLGIRFSNCRAQAPWTLPSHMSLFTSMLPTSNGVDNLNKVLPEDIPTLAQLLRAEGYRTAGLVNDGQMKAHWGFARGFETWREFTVDTPAGNCENLTAEATTWLKAQSPVAPFFLFLHYYDTHDPYAAPDVYRRAMGTTLSGAETRKLCFKHRFPSQPFDDPKILPDIVAAYDAEIAWLDHEIGKLLAAIPPETLVIVFADHGEAFKEHGWMLHGASLYEEETHVPLLMKLPGGSEGKTVEAPVMLMDVAPTILARCGIEAPIQFQGVDVSPLWQGGTIPPRLIPSESKAVLEGRLTLSVVAYPFKAIYSLFDGRLELYKLPDENKDLAASESGAAEALFKSLRTWMDGEQYWMLHAVGDGDFEVTVGVSEGSFGLFIPVGLDPLRDSFDVLDEGRTLQWHVYPGGISRAKSLFLQPANPEAALRVDFRRNGSSAKELVFIGKDGQHPNALPATIAANVAPVSPVIEKPFQSGKVGLHVFRHRSEGSRSRPEKVEPLDQETLRRLRSLGYVQ